MVILPLVNASSLGLLVGTHMTMHLEGKGQQACPIDMLYC